LRLWLGDIVISSGVERGMAQFVVRRVEDDVAARLKRRAKRHGRSMEDEVRHILRNAAKEEHRGVRKLGSRIAARFTTVGLTADLPELHGRPARAADFDR
jgi:plasmid stability protein